MHRANYRGMKTLTSVPSRNGSQQTARRAYQKREACVALGGISLATLDRWIRAGRIRALKPAGGIVLIPADEIERFLAGAESNAATA